MEGNPLLIAVDNHNIANGDQSWFETKADSVSDFVGGVKDALTYGAVGTVVAGVNSILNSGIAIANFVGADIEQISTYETLKSLDDNLGDYYKNHESGVEMAGFIGGMFVPGMAGVKALQAAKAGFLGTNMAKSTGLITSLTRDYATAAKLEFAAGNSPFTVLNSNVIKSLAQGAGSATLESAAFEIAVAGTMFKSPVLEESSAKDLMWNILAGAVIGGGLGGVLHGVSTVYGIQKARSAVKDELLPWTKVEELDKLAPSDLKLINYFNQKLQLPEVPHVDDLTEQVTKISKLDPTTRLKLITEERGKTLEKLDVLIRQEFNRYAGGDEFIGNQLYAKFKDQDNIIDIAASLINSKGASRITADERLVVGDVLFPTHGIKREDFQKLLSSGEYGKLFTSEATANTQGFRVIGDVAKIKVTGAGEVAEAGKVMMNRDAAFASGYDLYRNSNGTFSVNPESNLLAADSARRVPNNLIVDFESGGAIVDRATPGLADLATKARPIRVEGDIVFAGDLKPLKVGGKFDPLGDDYLQIQGRYIWAQEQKNIKWAGKIIDEHDFPLLERAYYDGEKAAGFRVRLEDGNVVAGATGERLKAFIEGRKTTITQKLNGKSIDEISLRLNVSEKWLTGEGDEMAKLREGVDYHTPRYARIDYPDDIHALESYNAAHVDGMIQYETTRAHIKQRHNQNFANYAGKLGDSFPDSFDLNDLTGVNDGAGASLAGFANSNYGTAGGKAQYIGSQTSRLKIAKKTETAKALNDSAASVNTPALRSEFDLILNKLRSSPEAWVFHPTDNTILIQRKEYTLVGKGGKPTETINMSEEVSDLWRTHSSINSKRLVHKANMKSTAGIMDDADLDVVYPPPIDTVKYKHFVFVEPRQFGGDLTGTRKRMIVAKDEDTLSNLIREVDQNEFRVITKQESEEWKKALGEYDFALGMNESAVDSSLKRKGVLSEHFAGNPSERSLDDLLEWHMKQEEILATKMVEHKYSQAFLELQHLGDRYTNIATSQFRSLTDALVERVKDPYQDIVKTSLDISRASEYQWWRSFNETVKTAIEGPARVLGTMFAKSPQIDDAFVTEVNKKAQQLGLGTPYKDAYSALVASGNIADKPFLAKYIGKAQAILSTTLLQLDFFNALNNMVSTPILLSSETGSLISAIQKGDVNVAGKLAKLLQTPVPGTNGVVTLPSVQKLTMNAVQNYRLDHTNKLGLLERYERINAVTDVLQQERSALAELTVDFGKLSAREADSRLDKAVEFGRKWSGNRLAEQMTRFVSADVMRQITDLALEAGVLRSAKEADEYIQLFVNKVQGNYLHSQRPIVFQGVVGQAISLFQTYQFNLMQQLFKYVGEGDKKSVAMLLGLQSSIYGMQGLPAFNFINTHIVGNAVGNTQHRDLYYASNSIFGKELGDWLLYGAGSNALGLIDSSMKINLYSRGDVSPRQATILPTSFEDMPVVSASVRFVSNLAKAAERTGNGAALWPTISQAVEHNGLSRPLAGLAQVVQGYTTTNQGSLLTASQDLYNIAAVSRIAGGKPFDESIALDALYRINAYRAKDLARIQDVGSALKTSLIAGKMPDEQEVTDFAVKYAKAGGRIENFNRFLSGQILSANQSQVNKLAENLNSPFAKQLQIIMGGNPLPDFLNTPQH